MRRKRGRADLPDSLVYALAVVLGLCIGVELFLLLNDGPAAPLVGITGLQSSSATGTVSLTILAGCSFPLQTGWNLISLCQNVSDLNITSVMTGMDYRYVMRWNVSGEKFQIFSPTAADNPFTQFELNRSYFVYINSGTPDLTMTGDPVTLLNIELATGWNAPSWPFDFDSNFTRYFNGTAHRYHMRWNATSQAFVIWSPRMAAPPPSLIFAGDGQFIYSEGTSTIAYNRTNITG